MLLQAAGKLDDGMQSDFDKHKKITQDFEENVIKELNENSSFKDSVLNQCRENLPLKDILEGKEFMAAGKPPVTRKMLIDMFGTDDWSKVKENLEVDFSEINNGNLAISLLAKGANSLNQISEDSTYFFEDPQVNFDALKIDMNKKILFSEFSNQLKEIDFEKNSIEKFIKEFLQCFGYT